ncbi:hypothetical protein GGI35DRAFT_35608 [Trichoderma velutinum]
MACRRCLYRFASSRSSRFPNSIWSHLLSVVDTRCCILNLMNIEKVDSTPCDLVHRVGGRRRATVVLRGRILSRLITFTRQLCILWYHTRCPPRITTRSRQLF